VAEIVAMAVADKVVEVELDEEFGPRSTIAQTTKWAIIPPNHAERESTLKTS
jgi:hypothetical protein